MPLPELLLNSPTPGTRAAYTTLEAELKAGETSMKWTLAPPAALRGVGAAGVGGQFTVVIDNEVILCEAGESKTVVILGRKEEGSAEAAHANGASVYVVPSAEAIKRTSGTLVQVITATESWKKPKGAQFVTVYVIGGGGGGGSGAESAEKVAAKGGGGGGGGALNTYTFPASALPAEVECTVGTGGEGGKNRATEGAGENGKVGNPSHFGEYLYANGGNAGGVGTANVGIYPGNAGGNGGTSGAGVAAAAPTGGGAGGGGGGGGPSTTEAKGGGAGGHSLLGSEANAEGGAAGAEGKEGAEGLASSGLPGHGGGGGGAGFDASAGKGGKGGKYGGGGGGGGGASKVGSTTGAGGAGGAGVIIIVTEF